MASIKDEMRKARMEDKKRISFVVSGTYMVLDSTEYIDKYPNHKIPKLIAKARTLGEPLKFNLDRPSSSFEAILAFYQTGKLHMPRHACPLTFKNELIFFRLPISLMEKCCFLRYHTFISNNESQYKFQRYRARLYKSLDNGSGMAKVDKIRYAAWRTISFMDKSSYISQLYKLTLFLAMVMCAVVLIMQTTPLCMHHPTNCEMLDHLKVTHHKHYDTVRLWMNDPDCSLTTGIGHITFSARTFKNASDSTQTHLPLLPEFKVRDKPLDYVEFVYGALFTLDLILRMATVPSWNTYLTNVINITDMIALAGYYVHIAIRYGARQYRYTEWLQYFAYIQILRFLRAFRLVKNVNATTALGYSIIQHVSDLFVLTVLLFFVVCTFSTAIYFIEDRDTIPDILQAAYWCIITCTSVGYGDIYPITNAGYVVSCCLAVTGLLINATTMPIFVNNFLEHYTQATIAEDGDDVDEDFDDDECIQNLSQNSYTCRKRVGYETTDDVNMHASIADITVPVIRGWDAEEEADESFTLLH